MIFRIRHTTRFRYDQPVYESLNEIRMRPLDGGCQRRLRFALEIDPPGAVFEHDDYYGNRVHTLSLYPPHGSLAITARSLVERLPDPQVSPQTMKFREFLADDAIRNRRAYDFLNPSRYVPFSDALRKFFWMARPAIDEDVVEYTDRVVAFVRDQFEYEPGVTRVHSLADEILTAGGGVCQDFTHLTIGVLRLAGVPARYVSGYLVTPANPPTWTPTQAAARATHAWLQAQLPGLGWFGFDPTHGCRADHRHIMVAVGRDYADVPPIKGVYRSAGSNQMMTVELDIEPADGEASTKPGHPGQSQSQQ